MSDTLLEIVGSGSCLGSKIVPLEDFVDKPLYIYDKNGQRVDRDGKPIGLDYVPKSSSLNELLELTGTVWNVSGDYNSGIKYDLGMRKRRIAGSPDETPIYTSVKSAERAVEDSELDPKSINWLIVASVSGKRDYPTIAQEVHGALSNKFPNIKKSIHVPFACAGFPMALMEADSHFARKRLEGNGLVIGVEDVRKMWRNDDRDSLLFGLGAGAVVLSPNNEGYGILQGSYFWSDPSNGNLDLITRCTDGHGVMTKGQKVLRLATRSMSRGFFDLENSNQVVATHLIPHQANGRIVYEIIESIIGEATKVFVPGKDDEARILATYRQKMGLRGLEAPIPAIYSHGCVNYGNSSAATCVIGLHDMIMGLDYDGNPLLDFKGKDMKLKGGDIVALESVGAGISEAGVLIRIRKERTGRIIRLEGGGVIRARAA